MKEAIEFAATAMLAGFALSVCILMGMLITPAADAIKKRFWSCPDCEKRLYTEQRGLDS